jgi:hypothetical protein
MRNLLRWLRTALATLGRELYPGRIPALRPVPKTALVVAAGLVLPFVLPADARPAALTHELAAQRLERFLHKAPAEPPPLIPAGELLTARPLFRWPAVPGAASYDFHLSWDGGEIRQGHLAAARYLMRSPGRLERGRAYRYSVVARDAEGRAVGPTASGAFSVAQQPEDLAALESASRLELDPHEGAFALAGYFAEKGSASDVVAALEAHVEAAPEGAAEPVADEILRRLGCR